MSLSTVNLLALIGGKRSNFYTPLTRTLVPLRAEALPPLASNLKDPAKNATPSPKVTLTLSCCVI